MNPGKRSFYSGIGTSLVEKILSGMSDFGTRSLNLSVLVNDPELREAYTAAKKDGQLPSNRARVLILGEPRAGKTSLLNRLLGKEFDRLEQPTQGIETRMCHVTNVDNKWNQSDAAKADDIRECASAVAILGETSSAKIKKGRTNNRPFQLPATPDSPKTLPGSPGRDSSDAIKIFKFVQLFFVIVVVYILGVFHYGYFVFVWCTIIALATILDCNNAYRFATSMSFVAVLFEALIRIDQPLEELACKGNNQTSREPVDFATNVIMASIATTLAGMSTGLGLRTGLAVAFSACAHPSETNATVQTAFHNLEVSLNTLVVYGTFATGAFTGFTSYKFCTADDRWHKKRMAVSLALISVIVAAYLKSGCRLAPYWFLCLTGCSTLIGGAWGSNFWQTSGSEVWPGGQLCYQEDPGISLRFIHCTHVRLDTEGTRRFVALSCVLHPVCHCTPTFRSLYFL
ncbi:uncharacterized protein LOC110985195 [Acanthaster planci]|uniref:Uncharacterized protein LOC110985195 n=1 Tax=Acanthaster planci TaxID=133434 RepID=A0A8B7Z7V0_ACAPL|nr:uncharacterized protein LOC110985195 [Acanthaster planci]XP_022101733.1 uncharacterized protein LOC110985195 [Acanthaster planci]